ncbi:hypothetical protein PR048_009178 [Dryococelus australis]|uniref:Uncharacterized protein n=1 Tax=Dryococelus australis TaxID=614101 RepID=A0ABQ9HZ55_9NEOP|nr:hypothetical protein PR048_009178 [Dryococelus australis]
MEQQGKKAKIGPSQMDLQEQGKPYISTTGVQQPDKRLKQLCKWRRKCFAKFNEKERENICMEFYKLSGEAQNQEIACSVQEYPMKTVRLREGNAAGTSRCSFSRNYFFNKSSKDTIQVCQTMYLNTLGSTLMKFRVIFEKKCTSNSCICREDGRGRHGKQKCTPEEAKQRIMNHIALFHAY